MSLSGDGWGVCAPVAGRQNCDFSYVGQRCQQTSETLDDFADALVDLINCAYPDTEPPLRMSLVRDHFIAGCVQTTSRSAYCRKLPRHSMMQRAQQSDSRQLGLPVRRCRAIRLHSMPWILALPVATHKQRSRAGARRGSNGTT